MDGNVTIQALRAIFNDPSIGTDEVVDGVNRRVTALDRRMALIPEAVAEDIQGQQAMYGVGMVADVMNAFLKQNPIFERFVLANCNVMPLAGNFSSQCVPKLSQVLAYMRLRRARVIEEPNRDGIAMYQAFGLCEMFGPHLPAAHKLPQDQARREIIDTVHWFLHSEDDHIQVNWFHVDLGLGPDLGAVLAIPADAMTIHQALIILEAITGRIPTSREWLNGISCITTVITSLCKQGSLTTKAAQKIVNGVKGDHAGQEVILPERTVRVFHTQFAKNVNAENAAAAMTHYHAIVPETSVRLLAVIQQAAESGMTVFSIIKRALTEHSTFRFWPNAVAMMSADFVRFHNALLEVNNNPYYGFNRNLGPVAANNFRSLGYLSLQILIELGGDDALRRYGGLKQTIPSKAWIDSIIETAKEEEVDLGAMAAPTAEMLETLNTIRGLLVQVGGGGNN